MRLELPAPAPRKMMPRRHFSGLCAAPRSATQSRCSISQVRGLLLLLLLFQNLSQTVQLFTQVCYSRGTGVETDFFSAILWFLRAHEKGHRKAAAAASRLCRLGVPTPTPAPLPITMPTCQSQSHVHGQAEPEISNKHTNAIAIRCQRNPLSRITVGVVRIRKRS